MIRDTGPEIPLFTERFTHIATPRTIRLLGCPRAAR